MVIVVALSITYIGFQHGTVTFPENFNLKQFNFCSCIMLVLIVASDYLAFSNNEWNFDEGDPDSKNISTCLKFPFTKGRLCVFVTPSI